jgi:amino acid transporter
MLNLIMTYLSLPFSLFPHLFGISTESKKSLSIGVIIGAVAGGTILLLLLVLAGVYSLRQKRRAERASEKLNPFGNKFMWHFRVISMEL